MTRYAHAPEGKPGRHATSRRAAWIIPVAGCIVLVMTAVFVAIASHLSAQRQGATVPGKHPPGRELVAPQGAPYTFQIPSGWVHAVRDGTPPSFLRSVGPPLGTEHSNAVVSVEVMNDVTDDQAKRIFEISKQGAPPAQSGWAMEVVNMPPGPARQVTFRGNGGPGGRYYFFDRPAHGPVFVTCQWIRSSSADESLRGCAEVVNSLTIKD